MGKPMSSDRQPTRINWWITNLNPDPPAVTGLFDSALGLEWTSWAWLCDGRIALLLAVRVCFQIRSSIGGDGTKQTIFRRRATH